MAGVRALWPADEESSAVALPGSECSLGICTLSWGRLGAAADPLLVRDGG